MNIKEFECGAWGWHAKDDKKLVLNEKEFFRQFISLSFKYGINLSTYGISNNYNTHKHCDIIVDNIFSLVKDFQGNNLLQAINYNFYSEHLSSRVLPSIIYNEDNTDSDQNIYDDTNSILFCALKEGIVNSFYYNLRTNIFIQKNINSTLLHANLSRFNSYIRSMHQLMTNYGFTLFDCTIMDIGPSFKISEEGYILFNGERFFYEDVYNLLPNNLKYLSFEKADTTVSLIPEKSNLVKKDLSQTDTLSAKLAKEFDSEVEEISIKKSKIQFKGFYKSQPIKWTDNHGGNKFSGNIYVYLMFMENAEFFRCSLNEGTIDFIHFIKSKSKVDIEKDGSIFNGSYAIVDNEITLKYQILKKYNMLLKYQRLETGQLLDQENNKYEFIASDFDSIVI